MDRDVWVVLRIEKAPGERRAKRKYGTDKYPRRDKIINVDVVGVFPNKTDAKKQAWTDHDKCYEDGEDEDTVRRGLSVDYDANIYEHQIIKVSKTDHNLPQ
jgi:hypothetical protein